MSLGLDRGEQFEARLEVYAPLRKLCDAWALASVSLGPSHPEVEDFVVSVVSYLQPTHSYSAMCRTFLERRLPAKLFKTVEFLAAYQQAHR